MDVICIGETLIDFIPGTEPASYIRNPGGGPANASVAMNIAGAQLGNKTMEEAKAMLKSTITQMTEEGDI